MSHSFATVAPRYTPGSPALVPLEIAEQVAREEKEAIEYVLKGYEGEERKKLAERLGLRGIAEVKYEKGAGKKHGWVVHDLITKERCFRLCTESLRKLNWRQYVELLSWEQKIADQLVPPDIAKPKDAWYKLEIDMVAGLPSGWKVTVYRPEPLEPEHD